MSQTSTDDMRGLNADQLLARFPGPLTLRYTRSAGWYFSILGGLVSILCLLSLLKGPSWGNCLGFLIFGSVFGSGVWMLLPATEAIVIDRHGFTLNVYFGFSQQRLQWTDARDFRAHRFRIPFSSIMPARFRRFTDRVGYMDARKQGTKLSERIKQAYGFNTMLPDRYNFPVEEMARLMNCWRALALQTDGSPRE